MLLKRTNRDSVTAKKACAPLRALRSQAGFSLIELLVVMGVVVVFCAMAIPRLTNAVRGMHLNSAANAIAGSIRTTRYQSIMVGCTYQLAFNQANSNYQLSAEGITGNPPACATTFSNVGTATPWSSTGDVTMTPSTTLQFTPNGLVTATVGNMNFTITNGAATRTVTVSGVGDVTIQ